MSKREDQAREAALAKRREKIRAWLYLALIAAVILGVAAAMFLVPYLKDRSQENRIKDLPIDSLGVSAEAAGCKPVATKKVDLPEKVHVPNGTALTYEDAPPAYGIHWARPLAANEYRTFFAGDRPAKELLVHSLEHGYTVIWYDDTLAGDPEQVKILQDIMSRFRVSDAVVAAPWRPADGGPFPAGTHLALTHWSIKGGAQGTGVWQYCGEVSGAAVKSFILDYPHKDAPEGGIA